MAESALRQLDLVLTAAKLFIPKFFIKDPGARFFSISMCSVTVHLHLNRSSLTLSPAAAKAADRGQSAAWAFSQSSKASAKEAFTSKGMV